LGVKLLLKKCALLEKLKKPPANTAGSFKILEI
jgi:hypothetical protein